MIAKLLPAVALSLLFVDDAPSHELPNPDALSYTTLGPSRGVRATAARGDG